MTEAGFSTVFVLAGDQDPPAGDYPTRACIFLEDLTALGRPFAEVGDHRLPRVAPDHSSATRLTVSSMWDKRRHATHVVSNLTFDADAIRVWLDRMRSRGITTAMLPGIPA